MDEVPLSKLLNQPKLLPGGLLLLKMQRSKAYMFKKTIKILLLIL